MKSQLSRVLGIDLGARFIGVSIFEGTELFFYETKTIKRESDHETLLKMKSIVLDLIHQFDVVHVAVQKIVFSQQHRSFVRIVYEGLITLLRELGIDFSEHNPKTLRQVICGDEKPTKANTAQILSRKFSELRSTFCFGKAWQKRYASLALGAVSAGFVFANELYVNEGATHVAE